MHEIATAVGVLVISNSFVREHSVPTGFSQVFENPF